MPAKPGTWTHALKIWNASPGSTKTGGWVVPRKGTVGYHEVREIMDDHYEGQLAAAERKESRKRKK